MQDYPVTVVSSEKSKFQQISTTARAQQLNSDAAAVMRVLEAAFWANRSMGDSTEDNQKLQTELKKTSDRLDRVLKKYENANSRNEEL